MRVLLLTLSITGFFIFLALLPVKVEIKFAFSGNRSSGKIIIWVGDRAWNPNLSRLWQLSKALIGKSQKSGRGRKYCLVGRAGRTLPLLKLGKKLIKKATCEVLHIDLRLGLEKPHFTAIATGMAWAGLAMVGSGFQSQLKAIRPDGVNCNISPSFFKTGLAFDFRCILRWRLGHIMGAATRLLWWWILDKVGRKERCLWQTTRLRH